MIQKLKLKLLSLSSLILLGAPIAVAGVASAQTTQDNINGAVTCGTNIDFEQTECDPSNPNAGSGKTATDLVKQVINILSLIVGAVAVIMLIVGGFRYITSGGKQDSVAGAKNTILYALIGLVIVAVAQVVVHFVLQETSDAVNAA